MQTKVEDSFDSLNPQEYLNEYYRSVDGENDELLRFFAEVAFSNDLTGATVLDLACGPAIYTLISLAPLCNEIHLCDYLDRNFDAIRHSLNHDEGAFNWDPFILHSINLERRFLTQNRGFPPQDDLSTKDLSESVTERLNEIKRKISRFIKCDLLRNNFIDCFSHQHYDVIISAFGLDSVAPNSEVWRKLITEVSKLLKNNGLLILVTMDNAKFCRVGSHLYAAASIDQHILIQTLLENHFDSGSIQTVRVKATDPEHSGYDGFIMSVVRKS